MKRIADHWRRSKIPVMSSAAITTFVTGLVTSIVAPSISSFVFIAAALLAIALIITMSFTNFDG